MPLVALLALASPASADTGEVDVSVSIADNLADVAEPMPELIVMNGTAGPITFDVFSNVPFSYLQEKEGDGFDEREPSGMCGNGFVPTSIPAGETAMYRLWSLIDHGPGVSGTYRVVLPYRIKRHGKEIGENAISAPFELRYGDVAPGGWKASSRPGEVVALGATTSSISQTPAQDLINDLLPRAQACVARAQAAFPWRMARLPWLRGRFSLHLYRYPTQPAPTLFVSGSLLGDPAVNQCLGALLPTQDFTGVYEFAFAVTAPR